MKKKWSPTDVCWVWDDWLKAGILTQDMFGIWHLGRGTDLEVLKYQTRLTEFDKRMLAQMRVDPS